MGDKRSTLVKATQSSLNDDPVKDSIFSIRERFDSSGLRIHRTKGVVCAVTASGGQRGLLTWKGVLKKQELETREIWRDKPKGGGKEKIPRKMVIEHGNFSFLPLGANEAKCMKMEAQNGRPTSDKFNVYSISGHERLRFSYDEGKKCLQLVSKDKKVINGSVEWSSVIGSPVVKSAGSAVVGVVGSNESGLFVSFIQQSDIDFFDKGVQSNSKNETGHSSDNKQFPQESLKRGVQSHNEDPDNQRNGIQDTEKDRTSTGVHECTRHSLDGKQIPQDNCYLCAVEASRKNSLAHSSETNVIDDYLKDHGMTRVEVPGDGHCILHAFVHGLSEIDVEALKSQIKDEFQTNLDRYRDYINLAEEDPIKQLDIYLESKNYTVSVVDLMPKLLANVTGFTVVIYSVNEAGEVSEEPIPPNSQQATAKIISLCKIGVHYDAVSKCKGQEPRTHPTHADGPPNPGSAHQARDGSNLETPIVTGLRDKPQGAAASPEDTPDSVPNEDAVKEGMVDKKILPDLAFDVMEHWETLCQALELNRLAAAVSIKENFKKDIYERSFQMLRHWLESKGKGATYACLAVALKDVHLETVRERYCLVHQSSSKSPVEFPEHLKQGPVSAQTLGFKFISTVKGKWKRIGRQLELDEGDLDSIEQEIDKLHEQCYQMLIRWQQSKGRTATYEKLAMALHHRTVDLKTAVVDHLCQG